MDRWVFKCMREWYSVSGNERKINITETDRNYFLFFIFFFQKALEIRKNFGKDEGISRQKLVRTYELILWN